MFKKGLVTLVCLTVMSALWSWAATTYSISAKINSLGTKAVTVNGVVSYVPVIGGTIKVREKAAFNFGTVYANFTTSAAVPVVITPADGYKLSALTKNGQAVAVPTNQTAAFPVSFVKPAPIATQTLVATFAVAGDTDVVARTWQLQLSNQNGGGFIAATRGTETTNVTLAGKAYVKNYIDTTPVSVVVTANAGYRIDYLIVDGIKTAYTTASQAFVINPATGSRVKSVMAAYKKLPIAVTTNETPLVANGISPVNPVADVYGNVRLVVAPTGSNNIVQSISVTKDLDNSAVAYTVTDRFGDAVTLPFRGSVKVTITGVTSAITVTPVYKKDNTAEMQNCTSTCHLNASAATQAVVPKWDASAHKANAVDCVTCHQTMPGPNYNTVALREVLCASCHNAGPTKNAVHTAAQNVCSTCHTFGDAHNPAKVAVAGSVAAMHNGGVCTSCHNATGLAAKHNGGAYGGNAQYVTQNITCANCHAGAASAIMTEWAESKHGDVEGPAWMTSSGHDWPVYSGGACKRCHTGIGFVDTLNGTVTAQTAAVAGQVLACTTCHSNVATGAVRAVAAYTLPYQVQGTDAAVDVVSVTGKSMICLPCHAGRASGAGITTNTFASRFPSSHYFTAGGTLLNTIGYHFAGQTYSTSGVHKSIGGEGPCVTCHMNSASAGKGHTFEAVTKVDGVITAINTAAACASCHADMTPAKLVADKATFVAALNTLKAALETVEGAFYNAADGKFYTVAGGTIEKKTYTSTNALGAAYNYYVLEHAEPAAYVHNRGYALKLIADSVEFLNTGVVTGTAANVTVAAAKASFGHATSIAADTCVTCHTSGTTPTDLSSVACASCHSSSTPAIAANVEASKHNAVVLTGHSSASCQRCHSTEGYLAFTASGNDFGASSNGTYTGIPDKNAAGAIILNNVSCSACHDSHNGGLRTISNFDPKYDANGESASNQFKLCTSCHGLVGATGVPIASGQVVSGTATTAMQKHSADWYRNIASSHYDLASTGWVYNGTADVANGGSSVIEGYNVRFNKSSACTDCHGHELYTNTGKAMEPASATDAEKGAGTIHTDWAQSAHAGGMLKAKFASFTTANPTRLKTATNAAAVMAAGVTGTSGPAWEHYNWDRTGRQGCQKCHTATGAASFLDAVKTFNDELVTNPAAVLTYNAANNDFSHLKGWTTDKAAGSAQNEVLYCWGCHTSIDNGTVRQTGAMPAEYKFEGGSVNGTFPNVSSSNLCVSCHGGRAGGMTVKARTDIGVAGVLKGFTNSHYLAAGGTLFKSVGYEYTSADRVYANSSSFKHDKLGTAAAPGTGTSGPCVACHLGNKSNGGVAKFDHKFKLGGFQGGTCGTGNVAGACHATMTTTELDEEKEHYEVSLDALNALLKVKGFAWTKDSPYFANADWTKNGTVDSKHMLGAAFNLNYLLHEPGAFAHNRYYVKRLIIDSLDFVYDGTLQPLTSYVVGTKTYYSGSDAAAAIQSVVGQTYADHAGVIQTFTQEQADLAMTYLDSDTALDGLQRR